MTVVRHLGKSTSGRYVYGYLSTGWWWQCDLHPCEHDDCDASGHGGEFATKWHKTWRSAFDEAYAHALVCPYRNKEVTDG